MADAHLASNGKTSQHKPSVTIRWDCQNVPINNPYLARYLLVFAESKGCLINAKAYANWRNEKMAFEQRLCDLRFDCIDVPLTAKNSVDKKLIADCMREIDHNLSLDIFILVTGDGDFVSLVRQLKDKGKEVIIFSQYNASKKLIRLANEHYFVDKSPELIVEKIKPNIGYNESIESLIEAIKTASNEGKPASFSYIGKLMRQNPFFANCNKFPSIHTPDGKVISQFNKLAEAADKQGKVRIENQQLFLM